MAKLTVEERPFLFDCFDDSLVGVVSLDPDQAGELGVLIVVGGPQYRVGSHRQFLLLARALAEHGVPCMRFDYRGMGDSTGARRSFDSVEDDIRAAIDAFFVQAPRLQGVMLWGLCDGASAAALYAPGDSRVRGLMLLNPWVRTDVGEAQVYLKHYYLKRLCSMAFWKKLVLGGVALGQSLRGFGQTWRAARKAGETSGVTDATADLPERMCAALGMARVPWRVVLSGRDYVAREFQDVSNGVSWSALGISDRVVHLPEADHTFSTAEWRDEVAAITLRWAQGLKAAGLMDVKKEGEER